MKEIVFYKTEDGKCPFKEWYTSLDKSIQIRIDQRLERIEENNFGDCKKLDNELSELRFKIGAGYRIYYTEYDGFIVLLINAGDKSTQSKDIKKAKIYINDFKERFVK